MEVCLSPGGQTSFESTARASELLVATIDGVHRLHRRAPESAWTISRQGLDGLHISSLLSLPDGTVFAGSHNGGLFRRESGTASWQRCTEGFAPEYEQVYCLAAQQRAGRIVLWAGTEPAAIYRSDDLGETWTELPSLRSVPDTDKWTFPGPPHAAHVKNIAFHPRDEATIYVCVEQGALLKSIDDGCSWRELTGYSRPEDGAYRDAHRIAIAPTHPDTLFLTTGEGVYSSNDAGITWDHLTRKRDRIGYPDPLFIDPNDEHTIYIAGAATSPSHWRKSRDGNPGIMRSSDDGATWHELKAGLPHDIRGNIEALSLCSGPHGVEFFAGTALGDVFTSQNSGTSWEILPLRLPAIAKAGHYRAFIPA